MGCVETGGTIYDGLRTDRNLGEPNAILECNASGTEANGLCVNKNAVMCKNAVMHKKEGTATGMPAAVPSLVRRGLII